MPVKGNKKKAEALLLDARKNFKLKPNEEAQKEQEKQSIEENTDVDQTLFADYMLDWLETVKHRIELITYISYENAVKRHIVPYFQEKELLSLN